MREIIATDRPHNVPWSECLLPWESVPTAGFVSMYAITDRGRRVAVLVPVGNAPRRSQYFCHGWSTGTFPQYGYSPGGRSMPIILEDEWQEAAAPRVHDIVVWYHREGPYRDLPCHSARIEGRPGAGASMLLSSKNGGMELARNTTFGQVEAVYSRNVPIYHKVFCANSRIMSVPHFQ